MSTSTQFLVQLKLLQDAIENREDFYTLYLDFSEAFDRVCHQILLKKRELSAFVVTCWSCWVLPPKSERAGVCQWLCRRVWKFYRLSTARFNFGASIIHFFIKDLPECCRNSQTFIFAGDTKITTYCLFAFQNDLLWLHNWAFENEKVVNADKTMLIWFSFKKPDVKEQPIVFFENEDVSSTLEPVKDLGVYFASTLSWTSILKKNARCLRPFYQSQKSPKANLKSTKSSWLPNLHSTIPIVWLSNLFPIKSGQILRNSKSFRALLPGGCLVRNLIKAAWFVQIFFPILLLFQLSDIIFLHYTMSSISSLNIDDLSDVRNDTFNYQLRPTTHFIQQNRTDCKLPKQFSSEGARNLRFSFLQIMLETSSWANMNSKKN